MALKIYCFRLPPLLIDDSSSENHSGYLHKPYIIATRQKLLSLSNIFVADRMGVYLHSFSHISESEAETSTGTNDENGFLHKKASQAHSMSINFGLLESRQGTSRCRVLASTLKVAKIWRPK